METRLYFGDNFSDEVLRDVRDADSVTQKILEIVIVWKNIVQMKYQIIISWQVSKKRKK